MSDLITVAKALYNTEAESIRLLLESHEIPVVLQGANTATMLSHVGSAVGTRVRVPEEFAERARQIIASQDRRRSGEVEEGGWYCSPCREEVDAGFETCWSCGQPRDEVERPFPHDRTPSPPKSTPPALSAEKGTADERVRRAWRIAVLGLGFIPIVSHIYSLGVLLEASAEWTSLSQESRQRFVRTMILDVVAILGIGIAFGMLAGLF
jgi:hypothetical protein